MLNRLSTMVLVMGLLIHPASIKWQENAYSGQNGICIHENG